MKLRRAIGLILVVILLSGCNTPKQGAGGSCKEDTDCYDGVKCSNWLCDCSKEEQQCQANKDCCGGLSCKDNKCQKLPMYCEYNLAGPAFLGSVFSGFIGFVLLIAGVGINAKASYKTSHGTLTIGGAGLVLIVLAIILLIIALVVGSTC